MLRILTLAAAAVICTAFTLQGDGFARERNGDSAAAKDALEGKAPPKLTTSEWLNSGAKAPNWANLKGKVVVLDFWAHW